MRIFDNTHVACNAKDPTMPKVIIIPYNQSETICRDAVTFANSCQRDFTFYLIPNTDNNISSPFYNSQVEVYDTVEYFNNLKKLHHYNHEDLVIKFYNGVLSATKDGLTNLFCAGAHIDDPYPLACIVSLKYLDWDILEEKYSYEVQKHSILHLIICGIIGAYSRLQAHSDIGCLLDMNLSLTSFNLKLRRGYYLCSANEFGCYDNIQKEKHGKAILQLCDRFKTSNYQTIIKEIIMGDKIEVGDITNNCGQIIIGKDIKISETERAKKNDD